MCAVGSPASAPYLTTNAETWDGSSWTEGANANTARYDHGASGTSSYGIIFGGNPPIMGNTEEWDTSSWTEVADLSTARTGLSGVGTVTLGLAWGGDAPPDTVATEEWTKGQNVKVITD